MRPDQPKIIHILNKGFAMAPDARECLNLAFTDRAMDANMMFARQIATAASAAARSRSRKVLRTP